MRGDLRALTLTPSCYGNNTHWDQREKVQSRQLPPTAAAATHATERHAFTQCRTTRCRLFLLPSHTPLFKDALFVPEETLSRRCNTQDKARVEQPQEGALMNECMLTHVLTSRCLWTYLCVLLLSACLRACVLVCLCACLPVCLEQAQGHQAGGCPQERMHADPRPHFLMSVDLPVRVVVCMSSCVCAYVPVCLCACLPACLSVCLSASDLRSARLHAPCQFRGCVPVSRVCSILR